MMIKMGHRLFLAFFLACGLVGFGSEVLVAGTTGKIAGSVKDAKTGDGLPGANILVEGTTLGAASDLNGNYVILNVPPGLYAVRASMIGYQPQRVTGIRVSIDLTTTVDFNMSETILETGQEVTVVAERPLVQKDMTSALAAVGADEIRALPAKEVKDVLQLQAGLVKDAFGDIHIRGGRSGEIAYQIDGVAATDVYNGSLSIEVENASVQELQVVSGTFNAEYGNAMSGIVNIVTKDGGTEYTGELYSYIGDYLSANEEKFLHIDHIEPLSTTNAQFTLSGPVPRMSNKLTFFTTGRYFNNDGWLFGQRWWTPQGTPGDSSFVQMNPFRKYSGQLKLSYKISGPMKLSYNVFWNDNEFKYFEHDYKYIPDALPNRFDRGSTHILGLTHALGSKTFYETKLTYVDSKEKRYLYEDPFATPQYLRDKSDTTRYYVDPNRNPPEGYGYVHPDSLRQPAPYSFLRAGTPNEHFRRQTSYVVGKFDLTSQITNTHQIKTGVEAKYYDLSLEQFWVVPNTVGGEEVKPFQPAVLDVSTSSHNMYRHRPLEFSAYLQDKMEFKSMIVNLGLRFDLFSPDGVVLADPEDPNLYDPFKPQNRYKNFAPGVPDSLLIPFTFEELQQRASVRYKKATTKYQLSPRLGVAYPITARGVIHFSYGWFTQVPNLQWLYANPDLEVPRTSGISTLLGNADLKPQRTVMYEIGLQQQLTDDLGFDVTLFYRDIRDWVGTSAAVSTYLPSVAYAKYENKDYSNVRGVTLSLNKRYANYFSAALDYSFLIAEGSHSSPEDSYNALRNRNEPRLALIPLAWDQRHTINGSVSVGQKDWQVTLLGRFWTGSPYTPEFAVGSTVGGSAAIGLRENSARKPSLLTLDLKLNKSFTWQKLQYTVYGYVYNLLDRLNPTNVFNDTGNAEYTLRTRNVGADPNRVGGPISGLIDFINYPEWYSEPRQVQLGLSVNF